MDAETERTERVEKLAAGLLFALMTGGDAAYPIPPHEALKIADLMDRCGIRQTDDIAERVDLAPWITERLREHSAPVPTEPDPGVIAATPRVRTAPKPPKKIPKNRRGVNAIANSTT